MLKHFRRWLRLDQLSLHENPVVFLHVPKTAGSSFTRALKALYEEEEVFHQMDPSALLSLMQEGQANYRLYIGHYDFSTVAKLPRKHQLLTFLREPEERLISQYYYYLAQTDDIVANMAAYDQRIVELVRKYSFVDFISLENPDIDQVYANVQTRQLATYTDIPMPEKESSRNRLLATALKNIRKMAFVGVAERYQDSMAIFKSTFGLQLDIPTYLENVNAGRLHQEADREIFAQSEVARRRVELDIQLYNSAKNRLEQKLQRL